MKPKFRKLLLVDYVSRVLTIMPMIFILVSVVILLTDQNFVAISVFTTIAILMIIILLIRACHLRSYIEQISNTTAIATILNVRKTGKLYFFLIRYRFNDEHYRINVFIPRTYKAKYLTKQTEVEVIYDPKDPYKVYFKELLFQG